MIAEKIFLIKKLQFTYPKVSVKDIQSTREAFSPLKRASSTSKHDISLLISNLVGHDFALLDPDPDSESGSNTQQ